MIVKLLTETPLELLSLKGGCRGSSESTHVKMPHCWKSHAPARMGFRWGKDVQHLHMLHLQPRDRQDRTGTQTHTGRKAQTIPSPIIQNLRGIVLVSVRTIILRNVVASKSADICTSAYHQDPETTHFGKKIGIEECF